MKKDDFHNPPKVEEKFRKEDIRKEVDVINKEINKDVRIPKDLKNQGIKQPEFLSDKKIELDAENKNKLHDIQGNTKKNMDFKNEEKIGGEKNTQSKNKQESDKRVVR